MFNWFVVQGFGIEVFNFFAWKMELLVKRQVFFVKDSETGMTQR